MPLPASQPWGFFFSRKSKGTKTLKVKKLKKTFKSWQKEIPVFLISNIIIYKMFNAYLGVPYRHFH